jgi:hypothetical protein
VTTRGERVSASLSPGGRPGANLVGTAEFRSYYGRPVLKEPVWTWEIPWYFFLGGVAGASAPLAFAARLAGNHRLARASLTAGAAALAAGPVLLTSDLGRPERAHHMLRVFRPTSPMNLGSWLLAAISPPLLGAAVADRLGVAPKLARSAEGVAAVLGPALATYTAVLVADTAVPVWHEAGRELPFVFAGSAAAAAGAAACLLTPPEHAGPGRRLAIGGAAAELAAVTVMERRLGELAEPYDQPPVRRLARLAKGLGVAGALTLGLAGRRRLGATVGATLLLASSACERQAVVRAGRLSASDPKYVVKSQRERLEGQTR